ncbi:hypothetical protein ROZALSC1DRAFT_26646 [Rozella allomycis CSF55]|uniref:High mobility group (HMG) box domain-containing protein n=1 Tax=Rozella allomycis (strain CSF55) TaxID=988480 RepID=A0A075B292_ROZAC|nr:High mobility group (HMG) box domain-containing protein [Rozella allomycis CSF55]RKP21961.1 hypothetical protein ROZALSC1DRAFT_26646 [Rozella allomycis CSF55]|eukprot:EPZ36642.1 High mobility group (HMG) box domain-containing protein [Rozella allomycis CSF55]
MPKTKDSSAPKRPQSSYFIYANEHRDKVKQENPKISVGELSKLISARWNELSESEKKPYVEKAAKLKEAYNKEMEAYKASDEYKSESKEKGKKSVKGASKKEKDPNAPKKATTAYFAYMKEVGPKLRADNPGKKAGEISKICGEMWKELPESSKKQRYQEEMKEYKSSGNAGVSKAKPKAKAKSKAKEESEEEEQSEVELLSENNSEEEEEEEEIEESE